MVTVIVTKLKQWKQAKDSILQDYVNTYISKNNRKIIDPSYQSLEYKYLLNSFTK